MTFVETFLDPDIELARMKIRSLHDLKKLALSMMKFATTSLLGTGADFLSFSLVFRHFLSPFWSEICAAFVGMVINFFMQKRFVFTLNRKLSNAFMLSLGFSVLFMYLGALGIRELTTVSFFAEHLLIAKVIVMGSKFVLNYFTKKWVFEK